MMGRRWSIQIKSSKRGRTFIRSNISASTGWITS
ncbi:unnamed protein product [Paramecium octaurelia]|uniref:Uncharacterized protein n=1 Tax=Paramecium octaurelia TaxID=43137 RepID=A0A8S1WQJ4_PAROT|nr:unnamed protein product [Paramecium octaurelia]